jgi:hypothetical protein
MNEYDSIVNATPGWERILDRYGVNVALLPVAQPLAAALRLRNDWRVVYADAQAVLFERAAGLQQSLSSENRRAGRDPKIAENLNRDLRITNPTNSL